MAAGSIARRHDYAEFLVAYLTEKKRAIEGALPSYLPGRDARPAALRDAIRYSVMSGGKRLRGILCGAAAEALGGRIEDVLPTACALELIHTTGLIHDDLPALDDDDERRGKPSCHVVYGEAIAILAGDALIAHAISLIASRQIELSPADRVVRVIDIISDQCGMNGLVAGQAEDILAENEACDGERVEFIHTHKTGALIRASLLAGAVLVGADETAQAALGTYGDCLGHAFQIVDDVLNESGERAVIGKSVGSDRERGKATYPRVFGLEPSRRAASQYVDRALSALDPFGRDADPLRWMASYVLDRDH